MLDDSIPMSFVMSAGLVQVEQSLAKARMGNSDKFMLVQDCFRHFDLDKVGTDDFHLSIFEMPGAFKFGPDGKVDTIRRMWHLATSVFGINKSQLWASYFKGDGLLGNELPEDKIVHQTWLDLGLAPCRVIGLGAKDNYWLQGKGFGGGDVVRKSGPNTELFYDRGDDRACGPQCLPGCKCGRFIEFSNSLFISYEVNPECRKFQPLTDPFSETVIGVERVAMILQEKESVFDIDAYRPILDTICEFVDLSDIHSPGIVESERILADHLKALYLLIADDAPPPGKNGRERIIKLLIRRVITQQILLGITSSDFLLAILKCISTVLQSDNKNWIQSRVIEYFAIERDRFNETLDKGYQQLSKFIENSHDGVLSGAQLVFLEKRMGFPSRLTQKMLREKGLMFPEADYRSALKIWRTQSQN
jgi:alanyl-tRNA synthetase